MAVLGLPPGIDIPARLMGGRRGFTFSLNPKLGFSKPDRLAQSRRTQWKQHADRVGRKSKELTKAEFKKSLTCPSTSLAGGSLFDAEKLFRVRPSILTRVH